MKVLALKDRVALKKEALKTKYEALRAKKEKIAHCKAPCVLLLLEKQLINRSSALVQTVISTISEAKTYLENDLFYRDINTFCQKDDINARQLKDL